MLTSGNRRNADLAPHLAPSIEAEAAAMARISRAALIALLVGGVSAPAAAQLPNPFEIIFGPARPPADVPSRPSQEIPVRPGGGQNQQPAPLQTQPLPPPQGGRPPVQANRTPGPPAGVQTQPLPPPPGGTAAPPPQANAPPGQPPVAGLPPGQRPPRGTPQPADTSPKPGDEVVVAPPSQKIANPTAVFSGLDKITGRIISFDVALNETVQFGALQVTPRVCYTRPPTETSNTDAFIEVDEVTLQGEVKRVFTGWMFAASPGLHAVEHPIYDVWLVDCKKDPPVATAGAQPTAKR
jgi:hypothetical protein